MSRPDYFLMPQGAFESHLFKDEPATLRGAFLWIAAKGRIVRVTVEDISKAWGVAERQAVQMVNRMERKGLISVSGEGRCRLICIESDLVRTCGFHISRSAKYPHGSGSAKWRGPSLPNRVREKILARDNHTCRYCGASNVPMHIDHIKPVSKGGTDALGNLTAACAPCNLSKGSKTVKEWEEVRNG